MSEIKDTIDEQLGGGLSKAEQFYEKNKRNILIAGGVVVLAVVAFFGYNYMQAGKQDEAQAQLWPIERSFETDSFDLVLNGDPKFPNSMGALDFVEEYGSTPAGQKAAFMAGRAYIHKKDYATALEYLEKFRLDDEILRPKVIGLMGDCNVELNKLDEAADLYRKAANYNNNIYTTPEFLKKLAGVQEAQGKYQEAVETYTRIKKDFAETEYATDIDKYISRANAKAGVGNFDN